MEAQIAQGLEDASVRVMDPAIQPEEPVRPRIPSTWGLALVLMLGSGRGPYVGSTMGVPVRTRKEEGRHLSV